jgi:serine/threonine-protein kinase
MLTKILQVLTGVALTTGALCAVTQSAIPQAAGATEIRFNEISLWPAAASARTRQGTMVVPDRNTTVPAYGGKMRLYDVHIARMIAMSHQFYCSQPYSGGIEKVMVWNYRANSGKLDMGTFNLRCTQVEQAVKTYGLGARVPITILNFVIGPHSAPSQEVVNLRTLDISGDAETARFLKFVQTIKPQR